MAACLGRPTTKLARITVSLLLPGKAYNKDMLPTKKYAESTPRIKFKTIQSLSFGIILCARSMPQQVLSWQRWGRFCIYCMVPKDGSKDISEILVG